MHSLNKKKILFRFKFHCCLFLGVQLTVVRNHWLRYNSATPNRRQTITRDTYICNFKPAQAREIYIDNCVLQGTGNELTIFYTSSGPIELIFFLLFTAFPVYMLFVFFQETTETSTPFLWQGRKFSQIRWWLMDITVINSLAPGRCGSNFESVLSKCEHLWHCSHVNAMKNTLDVRSTLARV